MSIAVDVVTAGIDLATAPVECKRRQALYARRCAFTMRKYVPVLEAILRSSERVNSDYGAGILTWNTPYAARQYYEPMNHTDPATTDHWDEKCQREDGDDLREFARRLYMDY